MASADESAAAPPHLRALEAAALHSRPEQEQDSTWLDIKIQCKTRPVNPMLAIQRAYT